MAKKNPAKTLVEVALEISNLTDDFCTTHLNQEYRDMCRNMVKNFCVPDSPALEGKPKNWAAGIVAALGDVNFLSDPASKPYMTQAQIAKAWGLSEATLLKYKKIVSKGFDLSPFDPDFTVPSMMKVNPMVWMLKTTDGFIVDARSLPRHVQQQLVDQGTIPFLPDECQEPSGCCGGGCRTGKPENCQSKPHSHPKTRKAK